MSTSKRAGDIEACRLERFCGVLSAGELCHDAHAIPYSAVGVDRDADGFSGAGIGRLLSVVLPKELVSVVVHRGISFSVY